MNNQSYVYVIKLDRDRYTNSPDSMAGALAVIARQYLDRYAYLEADYGLGGEFANADPENRQAARQRLIEDFIRALKCELGHTEVTPGTTDRIERLRKLAAQEGVTIVEQPDPPPPSRRTDEI